MENPRGIPQAPFFEDVSSFVTESKENPKDLLIKFKEMFSKYRFMDAHTAQRETTLLGKEAEINKSIEVLNHVLVQKKAKENTEIVFELNETLYAKGEIAHTEEKAYIWLGANVMVEYPIAEALDMLQEKSASCKMILETLREDKNFLREQITALEINIARLHNYIVQSPKADAK
jgi:prefoldin subunit 5